MRQRSASKSCKSIHPRGPVKRFPWDVTWSRGSRECTRVWRTFWPPIMSKHAAYCIMSKHAAYCIISKHAAYCIMSKHAAYCIMSKHAAYCIMSKHAAYCRDASRQFHIDRISSKLLKKSAHFIEMDCSIVRIVAVALTVDIDAVGAENILALSCNCHYEVRLKFLTFLQRHREALPLPLQSIQVLSIFICRLNILFRYSCW